MDKDEALESEMEDTEMEDTEMEDDDDEIVDKKTEDVIETKKCEEEASGQSKSYKKKNKEYIETLNMILNECKEEKPYQLSEQLFEQFTENMDCNENDSSDEDAGFANQGKQGPISDFFLGGESSNVLDPNNYLMVNKQSANGKIRKLIMCRSTAQNIVSKSQDILNKYKIVNEKWKFDNKTEINRVKSAVKKARERMHKGSEFRVLSRQYIREKIKPEWNQWAATFTTNDGGIYMYISWSTPQIYHLVFNEY